MKRTVMIAGLVLGAGLMLAGCAAPASAIEYADADAAREALNTTSTVTFEVYSMEDVNLAGDILADEKVAGYWCESGLLDMKWTVSVDDEDLFYVKCVTDEPINDMEGVNSGTTYGCYDMNDNCLGYGQQQIIASEGDEEQWLMMFLDAEGNAREDYYASEDGDVLYDWDGNGIASVNGDLGVLGGCTITFTMEDSAEQEVDIKDKFVMMMPVLSEMKDEYKYLND